MTAPIVGQRRTRDTDDSEEEDHDAGAPVTKLARLEEHPASQRVDLSRFEVEDLPGAEVSYIADFVSDEVATRWYHDLERLEFYHPTLKVYGRPVKQSRSIAGYTTSPSLVLKYSGHEVSLRRTSDTALPPVLQSIWAQVSRRLGMDFNCVLLNRYASGEETIGKHRDTKENGVIASLSLGAVRTFHLIPNNPDGGAKTKKWPLANGSLLVMSGATQDNWKHEIPKEAHVKDGRISLTFRQLPEPKAGDGAKKQRPTTRRKPNDIGR
uniref:Fe2OG dioxygenase domain-containing protein n=1 Tax=Mycena chlorophos TaxID=658473 RepID=A0ABQ0LV10_MYCCL|nr:predicted protein [Mycena chlorophos]